MASNRIEEQDVLESNYDNPVEDEEEDLDSSMTLVEHLEELRWRIFKSIIAIALGSLIAFIFRILQLYPIIPSPLISVHDLISRKHQW